MTQQQFDQVRAKFIAIRTKFQAARRVSKGHYNSYVAAKQATRQLQADRKLAWLEFVGAQAQAMKDGVKDTSYPLSSDDES